MMKTAPFIRCRGGPVGASGTVMRMLQPRCRRSAVGDRALATRPSSGPLGDGGGRHVERQLVVEATPDGRFLSVAGLKSSSLPDASTAFRFNATWLRHNCHCPACRQRFSGQKLIRPATLPASLFTVRSARFVDAGDALAVDWNEEPAHRSTFPVDFLRSCGQRRRRSATSARPALDDDPDEGVPRLPTIDYGELIQPGGLLRWLRLLDDVGVCLVRRVPDAAVDDWAVRRVAELVCPVQRTIYGEAFNVVADERPINVAYSDVELDYHMDLVYYESPPGIQLLHCVRFDDCVAGGESLFVDAWAVAERMRVEHPGGFDVLTRVPATFQKIHFDRERPVYMRYKRPHVAIEPHDKRIVGVFWAPAFEGPLDVPEDDIEPYYRAYSTFAHLLDCSPTRLQTRLVPGDLVCFNNRRVLHARRGFQLNGGVRHLQGCYINIDEFKSRLLVLETNEGGAGVAGNLNVKHVLNQCWT